MIGFMTVDNLMENLFGVLDLGPGLQSIIG